MMLRRGKVNDKRCLDPAFPTIYVKYIDEKGNESQVYDVPNKERKEAKLPAGLGKPKTVDDIVRSKRR
jgi:hypothetical protein